MMDFLDILEFVTNLFEFLVKTVHCIGKFLVWLWQGLLWLMGPLGAVLGAVNLILLPWFHSAQVLIFTVLLWTALVVYWRGLAQRHR